MDPLDSALVEYFGVTDTSLKAFIYGLLKDNQNGLIDTISYTKTAGTVTTTKTLKV